MDKNIVNISSYVIFYYFLIYVYITNSCFVKIATNHFKYKQNGQIDMKEDDDITNVVVGTSTCTKRRK